MSGRRRSLVLLFGAVALLLSTLGPASLGPSYAQPQGPGPWVVRAYYTDRQMVNDLAAWLEPWEVHHDKGYLVIAVDRSQYMRMLEAGFRLEIDQSLTDQLNQLRAALPGQVSGIPGYPCYRTVEETFASAQEIAATYPHLATWIDVADSWEKTEPGGAPGYDMMVLRLTNASIAGPKPKLFVTASMHGREYAPAELSTRFAEYLVQNYSTNPDVTWLLDYHEIHLMLQANPDGRKRAEIGLYWRKNTNENYCFPISNDRGADLNRNFDFQWGCCGGSSGLECAETYRGPEPASEPETLAIQNYLRSEFPDQRGATLNDAAPADATGVYLDIHSHGGWVLWPWGFAYNPAPNAPALQTLGRKLAFFNGYEPDQSVGLYPTDGTADDFAYGDLGLAAYILELGTAFFEGCKEFEDAILPGNLPVLVYAANVARRPYQTPAGPDAVDVSLSQRVVVPGEVLTLTATMNDTRFSDARGTEPAQAIAAAEYYLDFPPWVTIVPPLALPMAAADGAFDQTVEPVKASIETGELSIGRHIVFVRGQDANGNWGAFSAVFLHVAEFRFNVYLPAVLRHN